MKTQRRSSISFHLILAALFSIVALRCIEGPLEPVMPYTDVTLNVPLIDVHQTGEELTVEPPIQKNPDGTISYTTTHSLRSFSVDSLPITPVPASETAAVGEFAVDSLPPLDIALLAADLGIPPVTNMDLPELNAAAAPIGIDVSGQLDFVVVHSGSLSLRVHNTLPVAVDFPAGIVLRNNSSMPVDQAQIGIFAFGAPLLPGEFRTASIDLAGKLVRSSISTDSIRMHTAAGSNVTVAPSNGLEFRFTSTRLRADSAIAVIPSQQVFSVVDSTFVLDDSVVVQSADFRRGRMTFVVKNQMDVAVGMFLRLNDFRSVLSGNSLDFNVVLQRKDSLVIPISIDTLRIQTTPLSLGTKMTFSVGISTINSGGLKASITENDFVSAELRPEGSLLLRSMTGKITPMTVPVNSSGATGFNIGEFAQKFTGQPLPDSTRVTIHLPFSGGFPADYDLRLVARNVARGIIDSITLPPTTLGTRRLYPGNAQPPVIVLDKWANLDSLLGKFFPNFPDSFAVRGTLVFNPADEFAKPALYSITDSSKVYPSIDVDIPARFSIANGVFRSVEPLQGGSGGDLIPKDVTKSVKQAAVNVEVTNGLPLQLSFGMNFLGINTQTSRRDTLVRIAPNSTIQAAPVNSAGYSTGTTISRFTVSLNNQEMQRLNESDSVDVRLTVITAGGGNVPVRLRSSDPIWIRASGQVVYTINKPN